MSKHTPGPWIVGDPNRGGGIDVYVDSGPAPTAWKGVAVVSWDASWPRDEIAECDANARLIAAAPALYGEIQTLVSWWEDVSVNVRPLTAYEQERLAWCKRLLAKVEGEPNKPARFRLNPDHVDSYDEMDPPNPDAPPFDAATATGMYDRDL